ncbi:glycosyltransferase family 39 protein [Rugosimonospora africana]|uniref:glycosyltransferase family 39 protein n=1 Tax=Rugosimonospora africana TaxID=556532 RepID=UPI001943A635|nr:glycosyltransferase family 39 protein [Rugosimonospora africana]
MPAEERPPSKRIALWRQLLLFCGPAALTIALGWYGIGQRQMWNDEYATEHAATLAWHDLFRLLGNTDRVLTLYYVLMHFWVSVAGDSPAMLRLPAVVAMGCAAGFTALVGQRLFNSNAGLIAGVVFALLPSVSRYAQEARPYALAVAAATLSTLILLVALERPVWGFWLLYALSVGFAAGFHLVSILVVAPHVLLVWFRYRRSNRDVRLWKSIGAFALIAALAMPLAFSSSGQSAQIAWIKADKHAIVQFPAQLFGSYPTSVALAAMGLLGTLVLLFTRHRRLAVTLLAWTILPPVLTYVTFPVLHVFLFRYLLFTLPAWALLAVGWIYAVVRVTTRHSWPQLLIGAAVIPALVLLTLPAQHAVRAHLMGDEPDYPSAAKTIVAGLRADDGIAFAGTRRPPRLGLQYEMRHDAAQPVDVFLLKTPAQTGGYGAEECPSALPCIGTRQRIWLVNTSDDTSPWTGMQPERARALNSLFTVSQNWDFPLIHVFLLQRKA